jgi:hypothetical protein
MDPKHKAVIERFGTAIATLHDDRIIAIRRRMAEIASPQTEHDRAVSEYYARMEHETLMVALAQNAIEALLHDFFFLLAENEQFKLILEADDGTQINLADAVDVLQSFPFDWIEEKSGAGLESSRLVAFLSEKLNLGETPQERRARLLRENEENLSDNGS